MPDFAFKRGPRPEPTQAVKHEGHLYLHADSRGGSTFIEGKSERHAHEKYATAFGYDPKKPKGDSGENWLMSRKEAMKLAREDHMGKAVVHSSRPITEPTDISGFNGPRHRAVVKNAKSGEFPFAKPGQTTHIVHVEGREKAPKNHQEPRWDDDAFGLAFIPKGKQG